MENKKERKEGRKEGMAEREDGKKIERRLRTNKGRKEE